MSSEYYTATGSPSTGASDSSAPLRSEFAAIDVGMAKLPIMAANNNKIVSVNPGGNGLEATALTTTAINSVIAKSLHKDGSNSPTANIPMASFKLTGLAAGSAVGDSVEMSSLLFLSKSIAGGSNVTLSTAEASFGIIILTGIITSNINVLLPASPAKSWLVQNNTSGDFKVTIKTASGSGVMIEQYERTCVISDGVNINDGLTPKNVNNDIINGLFRVAQRGTSFAAAVSGAYDLDGWLHSKVSAAVLTIAQTTASATTRFGRSVTFTTADAAIAATDYIIHQSLMRGYEATKYLNSTFTISFDVTSSVTGIHCVSIYNGTSVYVAEYTINAANVEETKTIVVTNGSPLIASYNNLAGLVISFANAGGANFQQAANSWINSANSFAVTANQVNDAGTINNVFKLENVVMNLGTVSVRDTKSFDEDLDICFLYYSSIYFALRVYTAASTPFLARHNFPVRMNAIPTITLTSISYINASAGAAGTTSVDGVNVLAEAGTLGSCQIVATVNASAPL